MSLSVSERLQKVVAIEKSKAAFGRATGLSPTTVNSMLKPNSGISSTNLEKIASSYPDLNLRWLIAGEGEMWLSKEKLTADDISASELSNPDTSATAWEKLALLQEKRLTAVEKALKESDPDRAAELGIK